MTPLLFDDALALAAVGRAEVLMKSGNEIPDRLVARLETAICSLDRQIFPAYLLLVLHEVYHVLRGTPLDGFTYISYAIAFLIVAFEIIAFFGFAVVALRRRTFEIAALVGPLLLWSIRKLAMLAIPMGAVFCIGEFRGYLLRLGAVSAALSPPPQQVGLDPDGVQA